VSTLLIGWNLNRTKNYPDLYEAIKSLGSWWHHLHSTWLVNTTLSTVAWRVAYRA